MECFCTDLFYSIRIGRNIQLLLNRTGNSAVTNLQDARCDLSSKEGLATRTEVSLHICTVWSGSVLSGAQQYVFVAVWLAQG